MKKGSIPPKDITIINIYSPNIRASRYMKQMLTEMKGEIESSTLIDGYLMPHLK